MANTISDWLREVEFNDIFRDLSQFGWFHYVFPFLLIYAVVFTILNRVDVFEDKKPVKVIVALVIALFAVAFPISDETNCSITGERYYDTGVRGCTIGDLMISLFPGVTAFSLGILALYIVAAMLGVDLMSFLGDNKDDNKILRYILGAIGLLFVAYYFAVGFGYQPFDDRGGGDSDLEEFFKDPLLYIIIIIILFFWYLSGDDDLDRKISQEAKRLMEQDPNLSKSEARKKARENILGP